MQDGRIAAGRIPELDEDELQTMLCQVKGIGPWTVEMFQMFTLKRQNVLPAGDLGVRKGAQALFKLSKLPDREKLEELTDGWQPYRSLGSYFMYRVAEDAQAPKAGKKRKKPVNDLNLPIPGSPSPAEIASPEPVAADPSAPGMMPATPSRKKNAKAESEAAVTPKTPSRKKKAVVDTKDEGETPPPRKRRRRS
eukprot:scaffold8120_cov239-Pinguiococcus_pyrenoidosus.AAC.4